MSDIRMKHGLWVVVADGEKAFFLRNDGNVEKPNLDIVREVREENPATREQGTDRPGRFSDGPGAHRSAVADTDWHKLGKERFAEEIANRLYRMVHNGDVKEMVLVAPPLVLGEMRKKLHKEVDRRITAEIPKTLTNHTLNEIQSILNGS